MTGPTEVRGEARKPTGRTQAAEDSALQPTGRDSARIRRKKGEERGRKGRGEGGGVKRPREG